MKTIGRKFNHFDIDRWSNLIGSPSSSAVLSVLFSLHSNITFTFNISLKVQEIKQKKINIFIWIICCDAAYKYHWPRIFRDTTQKVKRPQIQQQWKTKTQNVTHWTYLLVHAFNNNNICTPIIFDELAISTAKRKPKRLTKKLTESKNRCTNKTKATTKPHDYRKGDE